MPWKQLSFCSIEGVPVLHRSRPRKGRGRRRHCKLRDLLFHFNLGHGTGGDQEHAGGQEGGGEFVHGISFGLQSDVSGKSAGVYRLHFQGLFRGIFSACLG